MKTLAFLTTALIPIGIHLTAQADPNSDAVRKPAAQPNPEIVLKLEKIVAIRQRQFKAYEDAAKLGRAPIDATSEINLIEARICLAREKSDKETVRNELHKLVAVQKHRLERLERLAVDRVPPDELDKARIELLNAEIQLLRQ